MHVEESVEWRDGENAGAVRARAGPDLFALVVFVAFAAIEDANLSQLLLCLSVLLDWHE